MTDDELKAKVEQGAKAAFLCRGGFSGSDGMTWDEMPEPVRDRWRAYAMAVLVATAESAPPSPHKLPEMVERLNDEVLPKLETRLANAAYRGDDIALDFEEAKALIASIEQAAAALSAAQEALEPFAKEAEHWNDIPGVVRTYDNVELWQNPNYQTKLTVGDLRRARAAYKGE
ncbi:hypothetical protein [Taklimakanibacter deserti]|uniref:hypothetical protein n=1 Tax=Taklimakanibacter deserti TaxID=2267839 RepID=UPI000E649047